MTHRRTRSSRPDFQPRPLARWWLGLCASCSALALASAVVFGQSKSAVEEEEEPFAKKPPVKTPAGQPADKSPAKEPPANEPTKTPSNTTPSTPAPSTTAPAAATPSTTKTPSTAAGGRSALDGEEDTPPVKFAKPAASESAPTVDGEGQPEAAGEVDLDLYDQMLTDAGGKYERRRIKLLANEVPWPLAGDEPYRFDAWSTHSAAKAAFTKLGRDVKRLIYYETRKTEEAAELLGLQPDQLCRPSARFDLTTPEAQKQAQEAEAVLQTALEQHDSLVQRGLRRGLAWTGQLRTPLVNGLVNLRLSAVDQAIDQGDHAAAEAACDRLREQLLRTPAEAFRLRPRYERIYGVRAEQALAVEDFVGAREWLSQLAQRYPADPGEVGRSLRRRLTDLALEHVARAERLAADKKPREASALLERAAEIWPELAGLEAKRRRWETDYPVLHCAYPELPANFAPMLVRSPVERHAAGLMFESLVRWTHDPQEGPHYTPQLAEGRPLPLERGRSFVLPACRWSDAGDSGHAGGALWLTAEDVRWTLDKLLRSHDSGRPAPAWSKLIAQAGPDAGDPFAARVVLHEDHWQPLSLMDFMVLPKHCFPAGGLPEEIEAFNRQPVGTGPFQLAEAGPQSVRFTANPRYRREGFPKIREVNFHQVDSLAAVDRFLRNEVDLIHGLRREAVNQLDAQGKGRLVRTFRTPSVWFLAPNFRNDVLQNQNLRLAVAHAIDREGILKQYFRPNRAADAHAALNGPYPRGSWAYNDQTGVYVKEKAAAFAAEARKVLGRKLETPLRLVYPAVDADADAACKQIQTDLAAIGVTIALAPASGGRFYQQVLVDRSFDLAYWRHDYLDETYRLWPLFDPDGLGAGGENFMGYQSDDRHQSVAKISLVDLFSEMRRHKQFVKVRGAAHKVHEHVFQTASIIPLWQLDTYVAVSDRLENASLEPLTLFRDAERWTLKSSSP